MKTTAKFALFRKIALAEGVSFLILLFIAMPLKYMAGQLMPIQIAGYLHGGLFIAFVILAYVVKEHYTKSFAWLAKAMFASIIPFGTFYMDKQWKKEEAAIAA